MTWIDVEKCWRRALEQGAVESIETHVSRLDEAGISFVLRRVTSLKRKSAPEQSRRDPFAPPYDPALYVGEVPPAHVALLNKFPVLAEHVLLVTRDYRDQEELLTQQDFAALAKAMQGRESLGFYNGGAEAGASQPHKHLQVVPLPLGEGGEPVPLEPFLGRLPFRHAWLGLPSPWPPGAGYLVEAYRRLWRDCGFDLTGDRQPVSYNLLLTRRHMWLVPRGRGGFEGIEVNALGFAGALLARDEEQAARIEAIGPLNLLRQVALEKQ